MSSRREVWGGSTTALVILAMAVGLVLVNIGGASAGDEKKITAVEVVNDAANPVKAVLLNGPDDPVPVVPVTGGREPIQLSEQIRRGEPAEALDAFIGDEYVEDFVVPAGKQLVIEYASLETFSFVMPAGDAATVFLSQDGRRFQLGQITADNDYFDFGPATGEMLLIRIPAGETADVAIFSSNSGLINVDVSGYLTDAP